MSDPKYAYPYPAPGNYPHGPPPPVGVPPQYYAPPPPPPPPPRKKPGFLEGLLAAMCCCCLVDECCCDPTIICIDWTSLKRNLDLSLCVLFFFSYDEIYLCSKILYPFKLSSLANTNTRWQRWIHNPFPLLLLLIFFSNCKLFCLIRTSLCNSYKNLYRYSTKLWGNSNRVHYFWTNSKICRVQEFASCYCYITWSIWTQ